MQPASCEGKATFGNDSKRNHKIPTRINLPRVNCSPAESCNVMKPSVSPAGLFFCQTLKRHCWGPSFQTELKGQNSTKSCTKIWLLLTSIFRRQISVMKIRSSSFHHFGFCSSGLKLKPFFFFLKCKSCVSDAYEELIMWDKPDLFSTKSTKKQHNWKIIISVNGKRATHRSLAFNVTVSGCSN